MASIIFVVLIALVAITSSATSVPSADSIESIIGKAFDIGQPKVYYGPAGTSSQLIRVVTCAMNVNDVLSTEFGVQALWQDAEVKILKNVYNLLGCMSFEGFTITA